MQKNHIVKKIFKFLRRSHKLRPCCKFYAENPPVYLSIACIAKNEGQYIKEWIEYHKLVGVERFYFYDNESTDNTKEVLKPYIEDGSVVYCYIEGKCMQNKVYSDAIYKYEYQTRWLAIIDLDEYIVPKEKNSIPEFLKDFENYPAVGINWVMFDSNGYETKPTAEGGLVTANYKRVMKNYDDKVNCHIKSIVNPQKVQKVINPHAFKYFHKKPAVDENYKPIDIACPFFTEHNTVEKICINHYHTKSKEEYIQKTQRGNADNDKERNFVDVYLNFGEYTYDYAIQKYLPKLKERMGMTQKEDK